MVTQGEVELRSDKHEGWLKLCGLLDPRNKGGVEPMSANYGRHNAAPKLPGAAKPAEGYCLGNADSAIAFPLLFSQRLWRVRITNPSALAALIK